MRRCTYCFRFHPGAPTYCPTCGRSFGVRICSRGHRNPRGVHFCAECGSADLSTPAPPASFLHHLSGVLLGMFTSVAITLLVGCVVLALFFSLDWTALAPSLAELALMLGFLYWTSTLLPGPIRKIGRAAGGHLFGSMSRRKRHE